MNTTATRVALVGALYFVIGTALGLPPGNVRMWRLAAWIVSGVVYVAHIGYEHFRLHRAPRRLAWHVALAVAVGAILFAIWGMFHALMTGSGIGANWLLALVIFPVATAVPAFLGALVAGLVLARFPRKSVAGGSGRGSP